MIGMIINALIKNKPDYVNLSNLNFIDNDALTNRLGLGVFKWIVKNTFFKYLNEKLTLKNKVEITDLDELRREMTYSEVSHVIGFGFVTNFALAELIKGNFLFGLIIMLVNTLLNLYPSLLQQQNKRRIDKLIKKQIGKI